MDCCNYVEAYAAGGHFYQQQQQYFCYDNTSMLAYAGYDATPISNMIDINARYNGAIPSTYPTDYVYNPKEARLRKAMREQSRELSRRSILQNTIANTNARPATIGGSPVAVSASIADAFLNQHHRFDCVTATVPSVPIGPSVNAVHRAAAESWFQNTHRPKPVHSPRISDWYGNVDGDPIERLQAMGTIHHHHQQQQRLDKCIKEQRSQTADCSAVFSSGGYSQDYAAAREREICRQESAEYADFIDGQKWHPYQNSVSPHSHSRTSHPSSQMNNNISNILHSGVQNANVHAHAHGSWGQFCHRMIPHIPTVARNSAIRGPRHAVFLRDRLPSRHCTFPEEISRMGYPPSKLDIDNIRTSYLPPEHQIPRLLESAVDSTTMTMNRCEEEDRTEWEPNTVTAGVSLDELVPTSTPQEGGVSRSEKERESRHTNERFETTTKKKPVSKQPLPGFHQAFGSTEIGKFSRSEFFVNMVGENSSGGGSDIGDPDSSDLIPEAYPTSPLLYPFSSTSGDILGTNAVHGITEDGRLVSRILPDKCCWFARTRHAITRIPDSLMHCAALLDYSRHPCDGECIRQKAPVVHPLEFQMLLDQRNMDYERIISGGAQRNYVAVNTDKTEDHDVAPKCGSQAVNLKMEQNQSSLVDSNMHDKSIEKKI